MCESGTISFSDPYKSGECDLCIDEKYECLGGKSLAVAPGYWRYNEDTLDIYKCFIKSACL